MQETFLGSGIIYNLCEKKLTFFSCSDDTILKPVVSALKQWQMCLNLCLSVYCNLFVLKHNSGKIFSNFEFFNPDSFSTVTFVSFTTSAFCLRFQNNRLFFTFSPAIYTITDQCLLKCWFFHLLSSCLGVLWTPPLKTVDLGVISWFVHILLEFGLVDTEVYRDCFLSFFSIYHP